MVLPSDEEKARQQNSVLGALIFTLLTIALETIVSLPSIGIATQQIISLGNANGLVPLFPTDLYAILYFLCPIGFCAFFSSILEPKRILSPVYVNLGTIALVGLMVTAKINVMIASASWQMSLNIFLSVLFFGGVLIVVGVGQTQVVRLMVGLNLISVDCASYSINEDFEKLKRQLKESNFGSLLRFSHLQRVPDETTKIRTYKGSSEYGESLVLAIGPASNPEGNTVVATVAYRQGYYGIVSTESASWHRDSFINDLVARLKSANPAITFTRIEKEKLDDMVSSRAYVEAIKPTKSKLVSIRDSFLKLHRIYQISIVATVVLFVGLTAAYLTQTLDFSAYAATATPTVFTLLIELGLSVREELSHRKLEEDELEET